MKDPPPKYTTIPTPQILFLFLIHVVIKTKTGDADADKYLDAVNQEIAVAQTKIRNARLSSFAGAF